MKRDSITYDKEVALGLAQYIAPIDTGNLRYNAIKAENTNDGFVIKYSLQDAYYIYFLEEGTRKFQGHKGFIGGQTVPAIAGMLYAKYATANDPKQFNHFKYYSKLGMSGINDLTYASDLKHYESLQKDIESISQIAGKEWAKTNDYYNEKFATNKITDYIDYLK